MSVHATLKGTAPSVPSVILKNNSLELNAITMKLEQLNVTKEIFTTKLRKSLATED